MFAAGMLLFCLRSVDEALVQRDLRPFVALDAAVRALPVPTPRTYASVAKGLTTLAHTPLERARAAYVWTTGHVAYSLDGHRDADATLRDLTGDCDAHASAYKALCAAMDVPCVTVPGTLRFPFRPQPTLLSVAKPLGQGQWLVPHAWNAVCVGGRWGLVDTTVAVKSDKTEGERDDYFLVDPAVLATDHVPDDPSRRLAAVPDDLQHTPIVRPFAWRSGLDLTAIQGDAQPSATRLLVRSRLPWQKGMRAALQTADGSVPDRVLIQPGEGGTEMLLSPPGDAAIAWLGVNEAGEWRPLLGYPISLPAAGLFPKVLSRFYDTGASLIGPFERDLPAGKPTEIRIRVPGASQVVAFQGQDVALEFAHEGNDWVLKTAPSAGPALEIMASYDDPTKFQGLLAYNVR